MTEVKRWSTAAASNVLASPDGAPEGWAPSAVNNWGRETMASVRRWQQDCNGELTATFAAQTYTLASKQPLTAGELQGVYAFIADEANTGTTNLVVNSLTSYPIKKPGNEHLGANDILAKQVIQVAFDKTNSAYQLLSPARPLAQLTSVSAALTAAHTAVAAASVFEVIPLDDVTGSLMHDTGGDFDVVNNYFTVPATGVYSVSGIAAYNNLADGLYVQAAIYVNPLGAGSFGSAGLGSLSANGAAVTSRSEVTLPNLQLNKTDQVQLWARTSAAAGGTYAHLAGSGCGLRIVRIG